MRVYGCVLPTLFLRDYRSFKNHPKWAFFVGGLKDFFLCDMK